MARSEEQESITQSAKEDRKSSLHQKSLTPTTMPSVEIIIYSYELEAYEKAAEETCVSLEKIGNTQTYFTVNYQHASELITFGSMVEKCKRTLFREPLNSLMYDAGL